MLGRSIPDVTLKTRVRDDSVEGPNPFRWQEVSTGDLFAGKRSVVFSLPGAFTPTCSMKHLPGFVTQAETLKAQGVDTIICTAVNDVFVMDAWGKSANADDKVVMAADGNGDDTDGGNSSVTDTRSG